MTKLPTDSRNVHGVDGPAYKVGPKCANPICDRWADDVHHIWRASEVANKDLKTWVAIDGFVIGNLTGLCRPCHIDITEDRNAIRWIQGDFWWCFYGGRDEQWNNRFAAVAPLRYQPPTPDSLANDPRASDTQESGPESCPFCGQEQRRRRSPRTRVGRRHRKSWTVLVPDEAIEDGADVLDSLIVNLAPLIPNADDSATGRYYVIVAALAHALMDGEALVASIAGRNAA